MQLERHGVDGGELRLQAIVELFRLGEEAKIALEEVELLLAERVRRGERPEERDAVLVDAVKVVGRGHAGTSAGTSLGTSPCERSSR